MRILLLGASGQVGHALRPYLERLGTVDAPPRAVLDLSDLAQAERAAAGYELVVNAAAWTDVIRAEVEPDAAQRLNAALPAALARGVARAEGVLLHYSTDYVFDGRAAPYAEEATPNPLNAYGRSKLKGELGIQASGCIHLIVRSGWIYSRGRRGFVTAVLDQIERGAPLRAPADQFGSPTSAEALAQMTAALIEQAGGSRDKLAAALSARGSLLHVACDGRVSRHELACAIAQAWAQRCGRPLPSVKSVATATLGEPTQRPADSTLVLDRLVQRWGVTPPPWRKTLHACLAGCDNFGLISKPPPA